MISFQIGVILESQMSYSDLLILIPSHQYHLISFSDKNNESDNWLAKMDISEKNKSFVTIEHIYV